MEVNNRQPGGTDPARKHSASDAGPSAAGAQRARRSPLESKPAAEIGEIRAHTQESVREAGSERTESLPLRDVLELAHAGQTDHSTSARAERLSELTRAYRDGSLNSADRISHAADKILLG